MPRKLRTPKTRIEGISAEGLHFLSDGLLGTEPNGFNWKISTLQSDEKARRDLWAKYREEILAQWIGENPGTRPALWWEFDAPECQRLRLGGVGTPNHEVLGYVPSFRCGIPDSGWVNAFEVAYYNGRAVDVHGNRIGEQFNEGDFSGVAFDRGNPPVYESEAAYLRRHNLLTPDEARRLKPKDFKPEMVEIPADDDDEPISPQLEETTESIQ